MGQADYGYWAVVEGPNIGDNYSCIIPEVVTHRRGIKLTSDALLSDNMIFEGILGGAAE